MNPQIQPWKNWKHVTKLDPDKYISIEDLETIVGSGTDAIMISGTQNITNTNVGQLISLLKDFKIPKILEPATPDAVLDGAVDYIFVPLVLNAGDLKWIVGKHKDWIQKHKITWGKVIPEAYIVMNPESAVAKLTKAKTDLTPDEVIAYAQYAEKYLRLPIVYMEYSGTYGDPILVKSLRASLTEASLFYGGGIESQVTTAEMLRYADVIVVGNVVYTDIDKFIETIP
ncbi:MAG TPA: phosphoglycerol geranylgeranyltransferase [Candidatus Bathyarchaeia archaeon]|nr:phosphoglycerol geranylgeranyltransferase [Candidatus Bathyarchaeia archaeon]